MAETKRIDFDSQNTLKLIDDAYALAQNVQTVYHDQFRRDWLLYLAYMDPSERDPEMPNISLPKLFSIIETKAPGDVQALFGVRPIIPIEANREEFQEIADVQTEVMDTLLDKAGIYEHGTLLVKMKMLYGTAFMNVLPFWERVTEKKLVQTAIGLQLQEQQALRLRLKVETWAPWDVLVDPTATSLSRTEDCRYVIKIQLTSKRAIKEMFRRGAYPDLDLELLDTQQSGSTRWKETSWGLQMMRDYGIPTPQKDDDTGILVRYESPDRYIDSWMGQVTLRDQDNPFKHGRINLSKMSHVMQPHSQAAFWGIGESKPNEIQIAMLNDLWNLTFASHGLANQPMAFFRKGKVNPADIVFGIGRRIPVATDSDRPISDDILLHGGTGLPADHYALPQSVERNIDLVAGQFGPGRGELGGIGNDTTATEVALTTQAGTQRQEMSVKLGENTFMSDFGGKVSSIIDQHSNMGDIAEIVGPERAFTTITANPADLPGGHNFAFQGSGRVAQQQRKVAELREMAPILIQSPTARPGGVERTLLKLTTFTEREQDAMQLTEEELAQNQQQQVLIQSLIQQIQFVNQQAETDKTVSETEENRAQTKQIEKETNSRITEGASQ